MDWFQTSITAAFAAGGAYAAVRLELRYLRERLTALEASATRAHARIDYLHYGKRSA